jgi:hypothetical protein
MLNDKMKLKAIFLIKLLKKIKMMKKIYKNLAKILKYNNNKINYKSKNLLKLKIL